MFELSLDANFLKINFNKTKLLWVINTLLSFIVIYFTFKYIWICFFINLSLKNYLGYFLWNFINISYPTIYYPEIFKITSLNFGYMILLNEHPIYWYTELQWIVEQFFINSVNFKFYNINQLEILILHTINNFFNKIENFFSFSVLFLVISLFQLIGISNKTEKFYFLKNKFNKKNLIQYNYYAVFIKIICDFLFLIFTPIILLYSIFFYFKNFFLYIYLSNLSLKEILFFKKWPNLFIIISRINTHLSTNKDVLLIKEKIKSKYFNELKYNQNAILTQLWNIWKNFFNKKNKLINEFLENFIKKISLDSTSIFYFFFITIKSYIFYITKLLNYFIVLINLFSNSKSLNFCIFHNQFFYIFKKYNNFITSKFLLWKPLFKRWSYYGFFSKTRTYWNRFSYANEIKF